MSERMTVARALHDVGLAAWFGGSLMGTVGVNGAAADVDDPRERARVANAGWARWTPVNLAAIGAHVSGAYLLARRDLAKIEGQRRVSANTVLKAVLTGGALAATAYGRLLGQRVMSAGDIPVAGGTDPLPQTPPDVARAQRQLKALQWVIPGLTGGMLVTTSLAGELERPAEQRKSLLRGHPLRALTTASGSETQHGVADTLKAALTGSH